MKEDNSKYMNREIQMNFDILLDVLHMYMQVCACV